MTVKIKTASPEAPETEDTAAIDAEAQAAAEMAAQAQQAEEAVAPKPVPPEPGENPDDNADDWAEFLDEYEEPEEKTQEVAKTEPEEVVEETPPVVEEVTAENAEETPAEEVPEVTPEEEVAAAEEIPDVEIPEVVPEEIPQETRTPEEVTAAVTEARKKAHEQLMSQYTMTEEQVEDFRDNPGDVLAKLAADMYLDMYDSMMSAVQQQVPTMVQQINTQNTQRQAADRAFFGAWPQLAKAEYRQTIDRIATNYRNMYPKTSNEDAIKEIGAQAWVALRLPLDQLMAHTSGKPQEVTTPPATPPPVVRTPAGVGKAAAVNLQQAAPSLNEYEELAEEFLQDDLGD